MTLTCIMSQLDLSAGTSAEARWSSAGRAEGGGRDGGEGGRGGERTRDGGFAEPVALGDHQVDAGDAPREEQERLVHVGEGKMPRLHPPRGEEGGEGDVPAEHRRLFHLSGALLIGEERLRGSSGWGRVARGEKRVGRAAETWGLG